jgi:phosphohistidine phosphatase
MYVYLFRHGIAVDPADPECPPDPERPLTETGIQRTRAAAQGLRALAIDPEIVLSSPYVRARQTADIAIQELRLPADVLREVNALTPTGDPDGVLDALAATGAGAVLCAGHAPNLDRVIARAAGAPRVFTSLKKAGLAVLVMAEPAPGRGELVALYPARALRALGA